MSANSWLPLLILATALALTSCGGGGSDEPAPGSPDPDPDPGSDGDDDDPEAGFRIGGSVTGLTGTGLVISNNASDELTIDASGSFAFDVELADGAGYDVEIVSQPSSPDGVCTVGNGSGTVNGANVEDVTVECTGAFGLVAVEPTDDDENVSRSVEPELTFSSDIDSATALPENILLTSDAGEVTISVDVSANVITLFPDNILLPLTEYTLTVTTNVQGSGGERLLEDVTTTFKTRDGLWHADFEIDAAPGSANDAQIAFDGNGRALAVWSQAQSSSSDIWTNLYTSGVGWVTAERIEVNDDDVYAGNPQAGFDAAGNALVVWTQTDTSTSGGGVHAIRTGASAAESIAAEAGEVLSPAAMAMNSSGQAAAVWVQYDGTHANAWSNLYEAGSWETAAIIDEVDHIVGNADVAIDGDGNVLAVWQQTDGNPGTDVWARRYTAAGGWEGSVQLSDTPNYALGPRPAFDADGNALVIWAQDFGLDRGIYASRFTVANGWEAPVLIKSAELGQTVEHQRIVFAPDGSALALWEHPVDDGSSVTISVFAARYTAADGWDTPVLISHGDSFYPEIAIDASGHALAVWFELDQALPIGTGYAVWSNRYTAGNGWTAAERIGSDGGLIGTFTPNIAVDPGNGDAFAIWTRGGEVWVNQFTSTETLR